MNLSHRAFPIISFLLCWTHCANGQIFCTSAYGGNLDVDDCLQAVNTDRVVRASSAGAIFSGTARDRIYRLPYHQASPNGACHFGVNFEFFGWEIRDPFIYTDWDFLRVKALELLTTCLDRPDGRGWGGYRYIEGYALKLMFWQEEEKDTASSQRSSIEGSSIEGTSPRIVRVQDGGVRDGADTAGTEVQNGTDTARTKCGLSCVIS